MHFFAVVLFFGFGVMALTMLGEHLYHRLREMRALVAGALGVALAWLADVNMWTGWGITNLRYDWVGVTVTGLAIGGAALVSYALVGFFTGLHRKIDDEAERIERTELRRVA